MRKSANDALATLDGLLTVIADEKPRFGVLRNEYDQVVSELRKNIAYAKKAGTKFNSRSQCEP